MKEVKIIVEPQDDGTVKIEAQGFANSECLKATKSVEEALGKVTDRKVKVEGHKQSAGEFLKVGGK